MFSSENVFIMVIGILITSISNGVAFNPSVEEVLNYKVSTTQFESVYPSFLVEEVLNYKVSTTDGKLRTIPNKVGEILNHKFV